MINPLITEIESLSDSEIDQKIGDLQKKYFISKNPQVKDQLLNILNIYREEAKARQQKAYAKMNQNNDDSDLDSLININ